MQQRTRAEAIASNLPDIVRRLGKTLYSAFAAMCGNTATYFDLLAQPVHQWMVRKAQGAIDVFVRFEQGAVVSSPYWSTPRSLVRSAPRALSRRRSNPQVTRS